MIRVDVSLQPHRSNLSKIIHGRLVFLAPPPNLLCTDTVCLQAYSDATCKFNRKIYSLVKENALMLSIPELNECSAIIDQSPAVSLKVNVNRDVQQFNQFYDQEFQSILVWCLQAPSRAAASIDRKTFNTVPKLTIRAALQTEENAIGFLCT